MNFGTISNYDLLTKIHKKIAPPVKIQPPKKFKKKQKQKLQNELKNFSTNDWNCVILYV